ncbi:MAG: hypothetical protein MRY83_02620 [Flavobacteriales bacterium]|nr:hypothetical protein [Flavobacteriales bacterium]
MTTNTLKMAAIVTFISALLSLNSQAQIPHDLNELMNEVQSSCKILSAHTIAFNQHVAFSNDLAVARTEMQNLVKLAKERKTRLENLPAVSHDQEFCQETRKVLFDQIDRILQAQLFFEEINDDNWEEMSLDFMVLNKNAGAESNKVMNHLNQSIAEVASRYSITFDTETEKIKKVRAYNLSIDHYLQNYILATQVSHCYNDLIDAVNEGEASLILEKSNTLINQITLARRDLEVLKKYESKKITAETERYFDAHEDIARYEINEIYKIYDKGLTNNDQVKVLNNLLTQVDEESSSAQNSFNQEAKLFFQETANSL